VPQQLAKVLSIKGDEVHFSRDSWPVVMVREVGGIKIQANWMG
jgi:hypothetical protein